MPKSYFQSRFLLSKIIRIFLKKTFVRSTFFISINFDMKPMPFSWSVQSWLQSEMFYIKFCWHDEKFTVDNTPKWITLLLCQWKKWKTYRAKCTILCLNFILCCYFANYAFKLFPSKVCYISSMTFLWDNWQTETKARLITPRELMSMKTRTSVCLGKLTYPRTTI